MATESAFEGVAKKVDVLAASFNKAQSVIENFANIFGKVIDAMGNQLAKFVQLANPAVVMRFNMAVQNAMSALGRVFTPALEKFTAVVQRLGNAIESLSPAAKSLISSFAVGAGLAGVFAAVAASAALLVRVCGILYPGLALVTTVFAGLMATTSSGGQILGALNGILKQVGAAFEGIAKALIPVAASTAGPLLESIGKAIGAVAGVLGRTLAALAPGLAAVGSVFASVVGVVAELTRAITPLLEVILAPLASLISLVARAISAVLVPVLNGLAWAVRGVADFITKIVNHLLSLVGLGESASSFDPNAKHAQAVRQSQMTDLRGIASKAYTTTFGGAGMDVQGSILGENQKQTKLLEEIRNNTGGKKSTDERIRSAVTNPLASANRESFNFGQRAVRGIREFNRDLLDKMRSIFGG
jgi:phage-related protein